MAVKTAVAIPGSPLARFPMAPSVAMPRILASSFGDVGVGKTFFALTAPAPIVVLGFDRGTEGVVEEFRQDNDKEIRLVHYDWAPDEDGEFSKELAIRLRDQFIEDYKWACQHARTVVLDKCSDLWSVVRYAEFGSPKADVPKDFDKANQKMRSILQFPKKLVSNLIAIDAIRDEWGSLTKKTGGAKRVGFGETAGIMHVDLFHSRIDGKFYTTIGKARGNSKVVARVVDTQIENLSFSQLGMLLFDETDEKDWV